MKWRQDVDFQFHGWGSGRFLFLSWHKVEVFALLSYKFGDLYVCGPAWGPPHELCWCFSLPSPPIFPYYSAIILEYKAWTSIFFHFVVIKYGVLAARSFLTVTCEGVIAYHWADYCLLLSSIGVLVSLSARLQSLIHYCKVCHLIVVSAFDYTPSNRTIRRSREVDWRPCDTADCLFSYMFDLGFFQDSLTGVAESGKQNSNDGFVTVHSLSTRVVLCLAPTKCRVTLMKPTCWY